MIETKLNKNPETVGLVIARKGSRRLPGKNARLFCGHPLVAWSIAQSRCAHEVDLTFLSTDGDELEDIGKRYGALTIRRPEWPDADYLPGNVPYMHALRIIKEVYPSVKHVAFYLPTSPLRKPQDTDRMIRHLKTTQPWPGRGSQVCPIVPQPETVVHSLIERGYCDWALWDKNWRYAVQGGGMSAWDLDDYMALNTKIEQEHWTDAMMDCQNDRHNQLYQRDITKSDIMRYIPLDIWQQFEIDEEVEFKLCEVLMEAYILKGKGMAVYDEYAATRNEDVKTCL